MLRLGFLSVLFTLAMATSSLADSSTPSPVNWSGAYLGATLGHGWSRLDYKYETYPSTEFNAQGIEGGILGGYNFTSRETTILLARMR